MSIIIINKEREAMLNLKHLTDSQLQLHIQACWEDTGDVFVGMTAEDCRLMAADWRVIADAFITQEGDMFRHALAMALVDIFEAKAKLLADWAEVEG